MAFFPKKFTTQQCAAVEIETVISCEFFDAEILIPLKKIL